MPVGWPSTPRGSPALPIIVAPRTALSRISSRIQLLSVSVMTWRGLIRRFTIGGRQNRLRPASCTPGWARGCDIHPAVWRGICLNTHTASSSLSPGQRLLKLLVVLPHQIAPTAWSCPCQELDASWQKLHPDAVPRRGLINDRVSASEPWEGIGLRSVLTAHRDLG